MANKALLKKLNKGWGDTLDKVGDSTGGFKQLESGNYIVHNPQLSLRENQNSGEMEVSANLTVSEGDFENSKIFFNIPLNYDWSLQALARWLNFFQSPCEDLEELEEVFEDLSKDDSWQGRVQVKVTDSDKGYYKVYSGEVLSDAGGSDEEEDNEEEAAPEPESSVDYDDMDRDSLEDAAEKAGLSSRKMKKMDYDEIRDWIEENGSSEAPKEEEKKTSKEEKKTLKVLRGICDTFGVGFEKSDTTETLKESLETYKWKKKDLEEEEIEALTSVGIKVA